MQLTNIFILNTYIKMKRCINIPVIFIIMHHLFAVPFLYWNSDVLNGTLLLLVLILGQQTRTSDLSVL